VCEERGMCTTVIPPVWEERDVHNGDGLLPGCERGVHNGDSLLPVCERMCTTVTIFPHIPEEQDRKDTETRYRESFCTRTAPFVHHPFHCWTFLSPTFLITVVQPVSVPGDIAGVMREDGHS